MNPWYQDFLISRNIFQPPFYYLLSISWYQEFEFLVSRNINFFLISRNIFLDIKNSISWYQEIHFLISRNIILDIKKWHFFLDIKISISWYQEFKSNDFLILGIRFFDIKKCVLFLDIKKCWINSKTVPHIWQW